MVFGWVMEWMVAERTPGKTLQMPCFGNKSAANSMMRELATNHSQPLSLYAGGGGPANLC